MSLTERELRTFAAIADAFFPSFAGRELVDRLSASRLGVERRLPEVVERWSFEQQVAFRGLLALFATRAGGLALFGEPRAFDTMPSLAQERVLLDMAESPRPFARQAFKTMRQLALSLAAWPDEHGQSPLFTAIGYPGPLGPPPRTPRRLKPIAVDRPTTWTCDVVVVGSGAGGGVAAAVLAKAGLDVVVLERGPYRSESDFTHKQDEAERELFEVSATSDLGVTLATGRCVGGGTLVNYSTSLRPPEALRAEWDRVAGYAGVFSGAELEASIRAVEERIGVGSASATPWLRDRVLERGAEQLGWSVAPLPRDVRGCAEDERCGYCGMGCRLGAKQSTMRTWLEDATAAGARLVVEAEAERVLREAGRAIGVRGTVLGRPRADGRRERLPLTVFARAVVVACGALHTPALLARSGVASPALGRHLHLHPVTAVWGRFDGEAADPWGGVMQARIVTQHADLDGDGYGVRFESAPVHPVELMATTPWGGAVDFKRTIARYREWAPVGVLLRDRSEGRVLAPRGRSAKVEYALSALDVRHVREGVRRAAELLAACGASEVRTSSQVPVSWRPAGGERLSSFGARIDRIGYGMNETSYLGLHAQGSARVGHDPRTSVCDEDHEVHGVPDLYVMDGSCFPTASGVNPMLTIEALAHRAASRLGARLS